MTLVEPGPFGPNSLLGPLDRGERRISDMMEVRGASSEFLQKVDGKQPGIRICCGRRWCEWCMGTGFREVGARERDRQDPEDKAARGAELKEWEIGMATGLVRREREGSSGSLVIRHSGPPKED